VCPQVGEAALGSPPGDHAVPGPEQVTVDPSPAENTRRAGVAVAVTLNPGTDAVADLAPHDAGSNHSHTGTLTRTFVALGGFHRISGVGSRSALTAAAASSAAFGGPLNTRYFVTGKLFGGVPHDPRYHCPGGVGGGTRFGLWASTAAVRGRHQQPSSPSHPTPST